MAALLKRRKEQRMELQQIEKQIYDLESSYLEETKEFGNIFIGWDGYLVKEKSKGKKAVSNEDRLFSLSSITSPASKREESKSNPKRASDGSSVKKRKKDIQEEE